MGDKETGPEESLAEMFERHERKKALKRQLETQRLLAQEDSAAKRAELRENWLMLSKEIGPEFTTLWWRTPTGVYQEIMYPDGRSSLTKVV